MNFTKKIRFFAFLLPGFIICTSFIRKYDGNTDYVPQKPSFWEIESKWVDSVFNRLSDEEKIGQLFMVAAYSNKDMKHVKEVRELIQKQKIGGLIFMQGGPYRQARLCNYYQKLSKVPLLISIDGEWGLAMRLDSTPSYPKQMTLGAISNDSLIYKMGKQIASECRRMGIQINFAPVADVNNNPENPVISMRSFGEDKYNVSYKAYMYMKGMQDAGIMANGKHFPGHGDTDSDSHKTLPSILHSKERLDSIELFPFNYLFQRNLASVMVAHLYIPSYDTTMHQASTLSQKVVSDLLQKQMGFKGLIFTDALNMKGASKFNAPGQVDLKALIAGNDVLLFSEDVPKALKEIKEAIKRGEINQETINEHCKKILKAKYWAGLDKKPFVKSKNIHSELNSVASELLNTELAESAVTLLKNKNNFVPILRPDTLKTLLISLGNQYPDQFHSSFSMYAKCDFIGISQKSKQQQKDSILKKIPLYDLVVISLSHLNNKPQENFGLTEENIQFIASASAIKKSVLVNFSNPYSLNKLKNLENFDVIVEGYEYTKYLQKACAEALFGASSFSGQLPVSSGTFKLNTGYRTKCINRIKTIIPEKIGVNRQDLMQIDSLAYLGIKDNCYPGCQVLAMKNGEIFFYKNYGKFTYEGDQMVSDSSIYDLASITKITASALLLMELVDKGFVNLDDKLVKHLPEVKGSNKENISIREMVTHQSGLTAWIPFYLKTIDKSGDLKKEYYRTKMSPEFPIRVTDKLYLKAGYEDSIYKRIIESKLEKTGEYVYSDVGYYFIKRIAENYFHSPIDAYLQEKYYGPMGLRSFHFKPYLFCDKSNIVPTEWDKKFRKQLIKGDVHDQGCAMLGGVAGHAGLFGNAKDLAAYMYMLLNKGNYSGYQWLSENTVESFTQKCFYCPQNRRGLCFDKPEPDEKKEGPVPRKCSLSSFGHSGFTGTLAWADPKNGLIYVFLSNRVYPDAEVNKLAKSGIRGKIHQVLMDALDKSNPTFN